MEYIGFLAGALTTASFVPQVWKAWRTRSVTDFSLGMLLMFNAGILLWLIYGLSTGALPVTIANAITLALTIVLLVLKLRE
jgi:MtN3 and saliva related transmembrane protein